MQALPQAQRYWVACSGGLDSTVLLHLAARLGLPQLQVVHVHHGLSPHADAWQHQVQAQAAHWGLPFQSLQVAVSRRGSLEEAAREARYAAFAQCLAAGDVLLVGHHQDDQAETLLLRLLRGAGLRGLGAMAEVRPLGQGLLMRPLLGVSRGQLLAYAQQQGLRWVEDESNQQARFDRNWLRHNLLPGLQQRWPQAGAQLSQTAQLLREDAQLLEGYLQADLAALQAQAPVPRLGTCLPLAPLLAMSHHQRHSLLRLWLQQQGLLRPASRAQQAQLELLLQSREDAQAIWALGALQVRRFAGQLYALPAHLPSPLLAQPWQCPALCPLPGGAQLRAEPAALGLPAGPYRLQARLGGERCHPAGRGHSQSLKKCLQDVQLEPWLRPLVPLVYRESVLVAVGDLWINQGFAEAGGYQLRWDLPAAVLG
jgi:tRNA(Ile)-lysidine synthase